MSTHTPGPWRTSFVRSGDVTSVVTDSEGPTNYVAQTVGVADAALIAAAPDLLEALVAMVVEFGCCVEGRSQDDAVDRARAAIAKARGY